MKKSLLALAVLGAFAGVASAQSSVTVYGKLDQAVGKAIGSNDKQVRDGGGSRLGFRGVEDLGGGLAAIFGFEHRFSPDTGKDQTTETTPATNVFWNGYSTVGLKGGFGSVNIGRQYTSAFSLIQNQIDPFAGDTIANLRDTGTRSASIAKTRIADSIRYDFGAAGFNIAADIAEAPAGSPDRPISISANYGAGPFFIGLGHENPGGANDKITTFGARYAFGPVSLRGAVHSGTNNANVKAKGYLLGAQWTLGAGDLKIGYANAKLGSTTTSQKFAVGYHYNLSKRTKIYADFARDNKVTTPAGDPEKTGYDFGLQHNF